MSARLAPFLFLLTALRAGALTVEPEPAPRAGLIELHGDHAVLVGGSMSADERHAVAWTVHPKKGQPPVKWNEFDKEDNHFFEDYCDNDAYTVTNIIVDLARRQNAITLHFSEPYFGHKNHGALEAVFGPERDGHRFALALSDMKWNTADLALIDLSAEGATQADLLKVLDQAVAKHIAKQHLDPERYATAYILAGLPERGLVTGFADAETVRVPFSSEVPKSLDARIFTGTVQLRLLRGKDGPHAEVVEVREGKGEPEPSQDAPAVAAADKELNAAYAAARARLDAAGKAKLLDEQRAWLADRDHQCAAVRDAANEQHLLDNPRLLTDRLLLKLTRERTATLRAK